MKTVKKNIFIYIYSDLLNLLSSSRRVYLYKYKKNTSITLINTGGRGRVRVYLTVIL